MPVSVAIQKLFPAGQRNAIMGLAGSGSGIGVFIFAPVVRSIIDAYGWRASYVMLSSVPFNSMV